MSFDAIHNYYREVDSLKHRGGTSNESSIRTAFQKLLDTYAKSKDLKLVAEVGVVGKRNKVVYPDGTLKDNLRQDWGYWESKDEADDLDIEVQKKFDKGYPNDNILFEDGINAILYRNGNLECRASFKDEVALDKILKSFIAYQRPEVAEFRKAIELFKNDVPKVTEALREMIINIAEKEAPNVGHAPSLDQTQDRFGQPGAVILQPEAPSVEQVAVPAQTSTGKSLPKQHADAAQTSIGKSLPKQVAVPAKTEVNIAGFEQHQRAALLTETTQLGSTQQRSVAQPDSAQLPKPKLKADKELGIIFLDDVTTLRGIPAEAWQYKLGNRSALEWILDQYKEKKPKDPTIAKLFNTYKFADYKEHVIDLLLRVTTVSIETMKIVRQMKEKL